MGDRTGARRYWLIWAAVVPVALWALIRAVGLEAGTATAACLAAAVLPRAIGGETTPAAGHETLTVLSANVYLGEADAGTLVSLVDRYRPDVLSVGRRGGQGPRADLARPRRVPGRVDHDRPRARRPPLRRRRIRGRRPARQRPSRDSRDAGPPLIGSAKVPGVPEPSLPLTGGCMCGGVRFEVSEPLLEARYCHCKRCQRRSGTGASISAAPAPGSFHIVSGEGLVRSWSPGDGGWTKSFCSECGSQLFSTSPEDPDRRGVRMGAFDEDPGIRPSVRQFTAYAPPWAPVPDDGLQSFPERRP